MDAQLDITEFDAVIVGTGIEESLIASSLARNGKQVLHLDHKDFYGGTYSSLNLKQFHSLIYSNSQNNNKENNNEFNQFNAQRLEPPLIPEKEEEEEENNKINKEENEHYFNNNDDTNISLVSSIPSENLSRRIISIDSPFEYVSGSTFIPEKLENNNRQFMIDVAPKSLFATGSLVNLLAETRIGKYLEFRCPQNVYMFHEEAFRKVPCSKSDVFQDKYIKMMEKRFLSKFLKFCMESESEENQEIINEYKDKPFLDFLKYHKLSPKLQQFTLYAIGMLHHDNNSDSPSQISTSEGLKRLNSYISSVGYFGRTAFLEICFGISEISQAFCRVCAVYGGIYILRRGVLALNIEENAKEGEDRCVSIVTTNGQTITAPHFIMSRDYRPEGVQYYKNRSVLRAVCITDDKLLPEGDVSDAVIPPNSFGNTRSIFMRQFGRPSGVCPKDQYLIHFSMYLSNLNEQREQEEAAMQRTLEYLLDLNENENQENQSDENNATESTNQQEKEENNESANDEQTKPKDEDKSEESNASKPRPHALYHSVFHQYIRDVEEEEQSTPDHDNRPIKLPKFSNVYFSQDPDGEPVLEGVVEYCEQVFREIIGDTITTTTQDGEEKEEEKEEQVPFLPPMPDPEESLDHTSRILGIEQEIKNNAATTPSTPAQAESSDLNKTETGEENNSNQDESKEKETE